jgi:hypothetical protein
MVEPLIHIGLHKTGTSWLQKHLFGRTDSGFFPLSPPTDSHDKLSGSVKYMGKYFVYDEEGQLLSPFRNRTPEIKVILQRIDLSKSGVPVISNERLCGNPHCAGFDAKEIGLRIVDAFPQAKMLIVIREQCSMILSTYYQFLSIGGASSLKTYMARKYEGRAPGFSLTKFFYHEIVEFYHQLYGPDRVLVLPYEMFTREPDTYLCKIAEICGTTLPHDLEVHRFENKGSSRLVASATRFLNPFLYSVSVNGYSPFCIPKAKSVGERFKVMLNHMLPSRFEKPFVQKKKADIARLVRNYYSRSNKKTSQLTGINLSKYGYM